MFVLFAVVEEVLVLVVVCCLQLLRRVLVLFAVVVGVLADSLEKCWCCQLDGLHCWSR